MNKPIEYKQYDSRWKNKDYSAVDASGKKLEKTTIGRAGCGTTCSAMVISTIKNGFISPINTSMWSIEHGFKYVGGGTHYGYFIPQFAMYEIKCKRLNYGNNYGNIDKRVTEDALAEIKSGKWLIACVGKGIWTSSGHYILVYGYENGTVYINDPASAKVIRAVNTWENLAKQTKYFWSVEVPETIKKGNPYTPSDRVLKYTKSLVAKEDVKWLQYEINEFGFRLEIDGKFGKNTEKALKAVQKILAVKEDGKCGRDTRNALKGA